MSFSIPVNYGENPGQLHAILCQVATLPARTMEEVNQNTDLILEWMDRAVSVNPWARGRAFPRPQRVDDSSSSHFGSAPDCRSRLPATPGWAASAISRCPEPT